MSFSKLYMILLGCKPNRRNTEQHDMFFSIGGSLSEMVPFMQQFWPDSGNDLHIDAWREVTMIDGYSVKVVSRDAGESIETAADSKIFFLNLGGYKPGEFDEFHYKIITVSPSKAAAVNTAKKTGFFRHTGFKGAASHIDDKYGVDVDDVFEIEDILPSAIREKYALKLSPAPGAQPDEVHLGYQRLDRL